jgi:hypothetical protein
VVGIGLSSGATASDVGAVVAEALAAAGVAEGDVATAATVDHRSGHPALAELPWPVVAVGRDRIEAVPGLPPDRTRLPVAEGSALVVAGSAATLLAPRVVGHLATAAVAAGVEGTGG